MTYTWEVVGGGQSGLYTKKKSELDQQALHCDYICIYNFIL